MPGMPGGRRLQDTPPPSGPQKLHIGGLVKLLSIYSADRKGAYFMLIVCLILQILSYQMLQYSLKYLIDDLIPSGSIIILVYFGLGWIFAFFLHSIVTLLAAHYRIDIVRTLISGIRNDIIKKLQVLSIKYFDRHGTGSVSAKVLMDMDRLQVFFDWLLTAFLESIAGIICVIPFLYSINPFLTLLTFLYIPLIPLLQKLFTKRILKYSWGLRESNARLSARIVDFVSGIRHIRIFAAEEEQGRKVLEDVEAIKDKDIKFTMSIRILWMAIQFCSDFTPVLLWIVGGVLIIKYGNLHMGELVAYVALIRMLTHRLDTLYSSFNQIVSASPSVASVSGLLNDKDIERHENRRKDFVLDGSITVRELDFSYESRGHLKQLEGVNISVRKGEHIAIVGESGSGKSTFINLLLGLYPVKPGSIFLGEHDICSLNLPVLRSKIAMMTQETFLFNTSIYENLRFASPDASEEEILDACAKAQILDFIKSLPEGLHSPVGEHGVQLSGGQRQRIGLARVFLRKPAIIILDEPSSALDVVTEEKLFKNLYSNAGGATLITIAHRISTISSADRIFVFRNGRLAESGSFEELKEKNGVFNEMLKSHYSAMSPSS